MGRNLDRPVQTQDVSEPAHNVDELGKLDQVDRPSSSHHVDKRNCDLNYADCILATKRSMQLLSAVVRMYVHAPMRQLWTHAQEGPAQSQYACWWTP
jgi:hypothetical protein